MESRSCQSSGDSSNGRDHHLKQVNKLSHKISKPTISKKPGFDPNPNPDLHHRHQTPPLSQTDISNNNLHQHQPPVYNINKNDFRDVVQRLTGSPAHDRISSSSAGAPPPSHTEPPKPQSSRLQRIRPPPLANVSNRPSPLLNCAVNGMNPNTNPALVCAGFFPRPSAPLSPLPPLPPVHAAAESPISAYMRYLHSSISTTAADSSNPKQLSGFSPLAPLVSPRWHQTANPAPPQQQENAPPAERNIPAPPHGNVPATVPFGCLSSPRSPYALVSQSALFSPTGGQLGLPLSPVPSPKYKGL